ncbi:MAG: AGE family epimerase/isomerase, partial [Rhodobacterales bacterium]
MTDTRHPGWAATGGPDFLRRPAHRLWLMDQARGLFDFFQRAAVNPRGGFFSLDDRGRPLPAPDAGGTVRGLHDTARMVHCFAMAHLLGLPGADRMIDHGMAFLRGAHHDARRGGWYW